MQDHEKKLTEEIAPILRNEYSLQVISANCVGYRIFHMQDYSQEIISAGPASAKSYNYPFCDVFVMAKFKKNKCVIADRSGRVIWPKEKYLLKNIQSPIPKLFGDFYLNCPDQAEDYLEKTYGEDWRHVGQTQNYSHTLRESQCAVKFNMVSYQPAKPFS